ncbi:MAG TPA: Ldh family oxidoreductase [Firmicutes bacterium]|nr:Ldh family oxidoreductase [Bacillota bacterium]
MPIAQVDELQEYVRIPATTLKELVREILERVDVPASEAEIVAEVLVKADLRGIESHGVGRLHSYYLDRLRRGRIRAHTEVTVIKRTPSLAVLDANNGMGQVAGVHAMELCLEMAAEAGTATTLVRQSNHYGIAGYYAMMALPRNMIGISLTNTQPLVIPTFGRKRLIGTNAISVAVPAGQERPFVLDMASSVVPIGRMEVYSRRQEKVPPYWGADAAGHATDDPDQVLHGGGLFPLGGPAETSGYKGYGLAMVVDILCGVLAGAGFLTQVFPPSDPQGRPSNVGHFFAAIDVETIMPVAQFRQRMDQMIRELKASPKQEGQNRIYIAGEKEFEEEEARLRSGIPVNPLVVAQLRATCRDLGVPWPLVS